MNKDKEKSKQEIDSFFESLDNLMKEYCKEISCPKIPDNSGEKCNGLRDWNKYEFRKWLYERGWTILKYEDVL